MLDFVRLENDNGGSYHLDPLTYIRSQTKSCYSKNMTILLEKLLVCELWVLLARSICNITVRL
jgi:hypothetical protein